MRIGKYVTSLRSQQTASKQPGFGLGWVGVAVLSTEKQKQASERAQHARTLSMFVCGVHAAEPVCSYVCMCFVCVLCVCVLCVCVCVRLFVRAGAVPPEIKYLPGLTHLSLGENGMTGWLVGWLVSIAAAHIDCISVCCVEQ